MGGKLNYPRFHLCKKPDEKTRKRGEMTCFAKVSKIAVFCKVTKEGTKGKCSKTADFFSKLRNAKKIGNTSRIIAQLVWMES